ncbi:MAG TPA: phosphatidylinositol-specific phospholipase C domain-containing protein [Amycolatopsis sp.]|uniref:phosphatidylinositol-specific phospholipase C domain-containing protein n=1 Tax=Amycolatopsis sp. TaxID=37632 RepID=UPI002B45F437|nr:phosphatidylinositol-specific phospholipase C domain-containing protein [Amycolatopsis sp.]HKS48403.1 phosphatidylinositol-specific phospholipase C domain-containing protein [Amycolatopsis sp.]
MRIMVALVALLLLVSPQAAAAGTGSPKLSRATTVGVHNTYAKDAYTYLAQSLDAGTSLVELDVWDDVVSKRWRVSHSNPLGDDNNCVAASTAADLYTGNRNQNLGSCLSDIRVWLAAHPGAGPIVIKIEMKAGFANNLGMGPDEFDAYLKANAGDAVFRPADLLGSYSTLDSAARANAWPSRSALTGKMIIEVIPGTFELGNPTDSLHTDVEYATYLKDLHAAGNIGSAMAFASVLGAASGDPRTQYSDTSIRPWFVFFDGDAGKYVDGGIDTSWYDTNHYFLIMTDAHGVSPAISNTTPTVDEASARVRLLATHHASVVTSDWATLTPVLSLVLPRG